MKPLEKFSRNRTTCTTRFSHPISFSDIETLEEITELQKHARKNADFPSVYYHCDIGNDEECDSWWQTDDWTKENSLNSDKPMTELITDERWQSFPTFIFKDSENDNIRYTKLLELKGQSISIPISWKIIGDIDFYFCSEDNLLKSDCYWVEITGNNRIFRISRCPPGSIPSSKSYHNTSNSTIRILDEELNVTKVSWNPKEWNGFSLEMNNRTFSLSIIIEKTNSVKLSKTIFTSSSLEEPFDKKFLFADVRGKGLMKIHDYNYLRTKSAGFYMIGRPFRTTNSSLCVSLYVSMCKICSMYFRVDGRGVGYMNFSDEGSWRRIKIAMKNVDTPFVQLFVETSGNEYFVTNNYWAIDYVELCSDSHFISLPGKHTCEYVYPRSGYKGIIFNTDFAHKSRNTLSFASRGILFFQITSRTKNEANFEYSLHPSKVNQSIEFGLNCKDSYDLSERNWTVTIVPRTCGRYYCGRFNFTGEKLLCEIRSHGNILKEYEGRSRLDDGTIYFTNSARPAFPPSSVLIIYSSENNAVKITWNSPTNADGPLLKYEIILTETTQMKHSSSEIMYSTNATTTQILIENDLKECTGYFVQIRAVNEQGPGFVHTEPFTSPVRLPDYLIIRKDNQTDTSIEFSITTLEFECQFNEDFNSYLFIILSDKEKDDATTKLENKLDTRLGNSSRIVAEIDLTSFTNNMTFKFTIGDGKIFQSNFLEIDLKNDALKFDASINITFICINQFRRYLKYYPYNFQVFPMQNMESNNWSSVWYFIKIISAIFIGILIALSYYKYKERKKPVRLRSTKRRTVDNVYNLDPYPIYEEAPHIPVTEDTAYLITNMGEQVSSKPVLEKRWELDSKPVRIVDFEKYVKCSLISQELHRQFDLLPKGLTKPCVSGSSEVNKPKNRTNNILPYDDTRVILQKTDMKDSTDYINANYIKGYKKEKAYIAAQGPKALTINDFWQMVWQENVKNIVMLINLEEYGVKKVEKYWPSRTQDFEFGKIHVFFQSEEIMADYEIRIFKLVRDGYERKVFQYHFMRWPDQGVPTHFQMLVPFVRKILELTSKSPILVHCSSGTAATGVFILCDICLRHAAKTGIVDVLKVAKDLREQRCDMIHNILQYKLAHLVIMECLTGIPIVVSCNDNIGALMEKLTGQDELNLQMRYLEESCWQNHVLENGSTLCQPFVVFPKKNKDPNIVPDESGVVQLTKYPDSDESSAYINAVKIDGYKCPERYIVTQQPMPKTMNDFWRLVVLRNIEVIISLNEINLEDKKSCNFWPTEKNPEISPVDFIILKFSSCTEEDYFTKTSIQVLVQGKELQLTKVNIFSFKGWESKDSVPIDLQDFLRFHGFADSVSRQFPLSIVTCYDGNRASGIYVATSYIIEKIKTEKCFDVCEAVKIVRRNRKQFISEEIQLAFLYKIAATYITGFQNYANFGSTDCGMNIYDYIEC